MKSIKFEMLKVEEPEEDPFYVMTMEGRTDFGEMSFDSLAHYETEREKVIAEFIAFIEDQFGRIVRI